MKRLAISIFVGALSVVSFADLRADLNAVNAKVHKAMMAKDVNAFKAAIKPSVTADFKYKEGGRTMTFDQMCENMKMGFAMMQKVTKAESKIVKITEKGSTATVVTDHIMEGVMMGEDKKPHTMGFHGQSTDTMIKVNGKWKMSVMSWGPQKMTMDGKPMDMSKMGGG